MSKHSLEPWTWREERQLGAFWAGCGGPDESPHPGKSQRDLANARQIAAAINFCKSLPTIEESQWRAMLKAVANFAAS